MTDRITLRLSRRADGRWQKKIDGKLYYFGPAGTGEADARLLLMEFLRRRALGQSGHTPSDAVPVRIVADQFAASCEARVRDGTLLGATWKTYDKAVAEFVAAVGRNALVGNLGADSFDKLRRKWGSHYGCFALDRHIQAVRTMFNWAAENRIIAHAPIYGEKFSKTNEDEKATEKLMNRPVKGDRPFTAAQVRVMLDHKLCRGPIRTFVLLGLNGGLYSIDISDLKWGDLLREDGQWLIHNKRTKTGSPRRCPLWPEVVAILNPDVRHAKDDPVFKTAQGNVWNQRNGTDSIQLLFQRLKAAARVKGSGFGALRHTHVSHIADHPDRDAARLVRAHKIEGIDRHYDFPSVERLKAVTDLARERLLLSTATVRAKAPRTKTRPRRPDKPGG